MVIAKKEMYLQKLIKEVVLPVFRSKPVMWKGKEKYNDKNSNSSGCDEIPITVIKDAWNMQAVLCHIFHH